MSLEIFCQFQIYRNKLIQIDYLESKITRYQKNWQFSHPGISLKLLEFDNNYMELQKQFQQAQKQKRDTIFSLAYNLEQLTLPIEQWESNQDLLFELFACFKQNKIDIQKQFSTLLLTYKQLEEKHQKTVFQRERERERFLNERDDFLVRKNAKLIQKLKQKQKIFDDLIRQKDLELTETKDLLENRNQTITDLVQTIQNQQAQIDKLSVQDNKLRQTILTYQDQINNHFCPILPTHTCPPCPLIHLPKPHECLIINKIDCSHSDYQEIKEQRNSYQEQLTSEEELVNIKDDRIDNLTETITKLNSKNNSKQKQIIQLVKQLRVIQKLETKNGNLTKLKNKLEKKAKKLERIQSNKKHNRQRIKSLNQKLKNLTNEKDALQNWKDNHDCSVNCFLPHSNNVNCLHDDYEQIKLERDSLKTELETHKCPDNSCSEVYHNEIRLEREKELITQIISELELTLPKNSSFGKVIQEIKKLIQKPGQEILVEVGEKLKMIRDIDLNSLEKELGIELSSEIKEQIERATNYQELSNIRNREIKNYLEKNQTGIVTNQQEKTVVQPFRNERVIWISLLVVSLLAIGGLLIRLRKKRTNKPF